MPIMIRLNSIIIVIISKLMLLIGDVGTTSCEALHHPAVYC